MSHDRAEYRDANHWTVNASMTKHTERLGGDEKYALTPARPGIWVNNVLVRA